MKSDNYLIVCTALVAATRLIGADLVNAVYPVVVERLRHPKEHVRKKAVMALHWFGQLDPRRDGPLAGVELDKHFRTMLCDKDPSVMSASLCALHDSIKVDPRPYKNLIPSFTSILKQVSEHRLPKSYDYHRFPAPFIQIKLLKILAALGAGDRAASENMAAVLHQTLRRASTSHTIGSAIIYECVRTITTIYPNPQLLAAAAESIATFLRSPSHNLRYVGIDALAGITALNPAAAAEHQVAVLDCLEDPDDTLKLKTLELLYKMTKANNIQVIVDKMMGFLSSCTDEHIRKDIVRKVCDLAERYAPSPAWFVTTISEVFRLAGEHVDEADAHRLVRLIAEQDASLHASAVEAYLELLDGENVISSGAEAVTATASGTVTTTPRLSRKKLPETILLVICWVLGEFGHLARRPAQAVLARLVGILHVHKAASDRLRGCLLTALAKLAAHTGGATGPVGQTLIQPHDGVAGSAAGGAAGQDAADLVHKCLNSQSLELQQRAHELQALLRCAPPVLAAAMPVDASCEEFSPQDLAAVAALPFLEGHVARALAGGAAPYLPPEARGGRTGDGGSKGLRFAAYEPAPYAIPLAAASTSYAATGAYDSRSGSITGASGTGLAAGVAAAAAVVPSASSTTEPQLMVKPAGGRKWGPAQYETDYGASASSSQTAPLAAAMGPPPPAAAAAPRSVGAHHSRSGSSASLTGQTPSERERFAASLFGGGGSASTTTAVRPTAAAQLPAGQRQLNGSAIATATRPASSYAVPTPNPMDLLLDLDVPPPPQQQRPAGPAAVASSHGASQPAGNWMDSMMAAPAGPMSSAAPLGGVGQVGGSAPSGGSFLGPGVSNGGMMYGIQASRPPLQQQPGGMGIAMPAPMGGMLSSLQQPHLVQASGFGGEMGMGMAGGPAGYGAAAPPVQPQAWQQQQMASGMAAPIWPQQQQQQRRQQQQQQQAGRSADPFGDLLS
ncbi:hypothetical protein Vafri_19255 [Volvox africanus]|nr:hypothetical protein Vafri_19255 [Volvox africanus]